LAQDKLREGSAVPVRGELMQILRCAQNGRVSAMNGERKREIMEVLRRAKDELATLGRTTAVEIESVVKAFENVAGYAESILNSAGAIVGCVEGESVSSVLPKVRTLGEAARQCIGDRVQATARILETVSTEARVLRQLSEVTRGQEAIALETRALSILTNVEVARLGAEGEGFEYLAHELVGFSKSVAEDTQEITCHRDAHAVAVEETRRVLTCELPRLRKEFGRMEEALGEALSAVTSALEQLAGTPLRFRECVADVSRQVAGVVTAVQAHDITRQQIEHVQEALALIAARVSGAGECEDDPGNELGPAHAGLIIQAYQLRSSRETVASWAGQIRTCIEGILKVSASEVVEIGPAVLEGERNVCSGLAHIERLERDSLAYSENIQRTFGGLANLVQLVSDHLKRSTSIRDHLQLLTFNSIIEANRLGKRAAAILAIANSIKDISAGWAQVTSRSEHSMLEVKDLEHRTGELMEAFSATRNVQLREAQQKIGAVLEALRAAAEFAARQAQMTQGSTEKMQAATAEIDRSVDRLDSCLGRIDAVVHEIETLRQAWETSQPGVERCYDPGNVEELFGSFYSSETERSVLRAALAGDALPVVKSSIEGNTVELF